MKAKELARMEVAELKSKLVEIKKELMKENAQVATGTVAKNPGKIKVMKKTVAKIMIILSQKKLKKPMEVWMSEICDKCGLPKELCVCETIAKETQKIIVTIEKRRFNKKYTVVKGIDNKEINLKDLTKKLKTKLACGGTSKGNQVELQGDHKQKVKEILIAFGFAPETIIMKWKPKTYYVTNW